MRRASSVAQESAFDLPEPQSVPHTRYGYQHLSGNSYEDKIRNRNALFTVKRDIHARMSL